ncbi:hypothetical protein ACFW35_00130 [Fictibacillus sp. NPDC058756]|uniref:hypothetical protein n=1 Tax=Fictibacillus sp. NPDC058756 TaxID=3346625 RepID=UPI0036CF99DF
MGLKNATADLSIVSRETSVAVTFKKWIKILKFIGEILFKTMIPSSRFQKWFY